MGRIGRSYPRVPQPAQAPIADQRVLFLAPGTALRYRLLRAHTMLWVILMVALIGAAVAIGL
jgi:hypothetical protein